VEKNLSTNARTKNPDKTKIQNAKKQQKQTNTNINFTLNMEAIQKKTKKIK